MYTGLQDKVSFSDIVFPFLFYLTTQIIASSMQKKRLMAITKIINRCHPTLDWTINKPKCKSIKFNFG